MSDNTMNIILDGIVCTVDCITDFGLDGSKVKRPVDTSNLVEVTRLGDRLRRFITDPELRTLPADMTDLIRSGLAVVKAETIKTETEEQKRIKELELKVSSMQAQIDRLSQDMQSAKSGWL